MQTDKYGRCHPAVVDEASKHGSEFFFLRFFKEKTVDMALWHLAAFSKSWGISQDEKMH